MLPAKQYGDGEFSPRQFPLDPFAAHNAPRVPWSLDATKLPEDDDLNVQAKVILVLGEPPLEAILPLLYSPHLVSSLVLLLTARPYNIPRNISPAIAILRLRTPLSTSESAAPRLVNMLQWADQVASAWRNHPTPPQIQELSEDAPTGYLTPPQRNSWFGSNSASPSPSNSELGLAPPSRSLSRLSSMSGRSSTLGGSSTSLSTLTKTKTTKTLKSQQHSFDSLFNFLPPNAPDRHLLKHAILVTTISRPFLTCTLPTQYSKSETKPKRRFSIRTHAVSELEEPMPPPLSPAHIVHLVPPARTALLRPLESFCLTFAHPAGRSAPHINAPSRIDMGIPGPTPRPFILPPIALGEVLPMSRKWTIAELILCGALDSEEPTISHFSTINDPSIRNLAKTNRAWMSGAGDIIVVGAGRAFQKSPSRTAAPSLDGFGWYDSTSGTRTRTDTPSGSEQSGSDNAQSSSQSQWPTPPSSTSSSPSASPYPTKPNGLVTPPESDTSESLGTVKRRKGLFRWMKR